MVHSLQRCRWPRDHEGVAMKRKREGVSAILRRQRQPRQPEPEPEPDDALWQKPAVFAADENRELLTASGGIVTPIEGVTPMTGVIRSLLPGFPLERGAVCFHFHNVIDGQYVAIEAAKGGAFSCLRCRRSYVAKKRRPYRDAAHTCWECGTDIPRGPKLPKRWEWVEWTDEMPTNQGA